MYHMFFIRKGCFAFGILVDLLLFSSENTFVWAEQMHDKADFNFKAEYGLKPNPKIYSLR